MESLAAALDGRYKIERELGRGGMASVWLARDVRHDRTVAIKVLHPELAGAIGVDRFLREVRLTARLQHPYIIPVLDSGMFQNTDGVTLPWYAMPYLEGESLRQRLQRERHTPVEEALRITRDVAGALATAHRMHIVHRDIKPENLMLSGGHAYIADFGIAKALIDTGGERLTSTGFAIGTPAYMSPEQATAAEVDARTDQYSLASVLYEMLAGEPPYTGPTAQAMVARRLVEPPRPIRTVRSTVPEAVEAVVLRALERVPADRFADVGAFAAALEHAARRERVRLPAKWLIRMGAVVAVLAAVVILGSNLAHRPGAAQAQRDPAVMALYERGIRDYDSRTPEGANQAVQSLTAAVRQDSTFGAAWAGLARAYVRAYVRYFVLPGLAHDSLPRLAVRAVERALETDSSADALMTQAAVLRIVDPTDVSLAIRAARRALELDSTLTEAWHFLALSLAETGRMDDALPAWRRSISANPAWLLGLGFMAQAHYWHRQFDSAAVWADSALAVDPNYLLGRQQAGSAALARGDFTRAMAQFEAATRLVTDIEQVNSMALLATTLGRAGRPADARRVLARTETLAAAYTPVPHHTAAFLAQAHVALGDRAAALAWLRRYSPREDLHFQIHLRCEILFDPIAEDPRFRSLLITSVRETGPDC